MVQLNRQVASANIIFFVGDRFPDQNNAEYAEQANILSKESYSKAEDGNKQMLSKFQLRDEYIKSQDAHAGVSLHKLLRRRNMRIKGLHWKAVGVLVWGGLFVTNLAALEVEKTAKTRPKQKRGQFGGNRRQVAPGLLLGGSFRTRAEVKNDFNFNHSKQDYFLTQLRLNLKWSPNTWLTLFVEGQDARVFGEELTSVPAINDAATPNIYADALDLHRGYPGIL